MGFNTFGETFVMTINRTGAKSYTAVGQSPLSPAPFFEFVLGDFPGVQGDWVRTGRNTFDSSWIVVDWIDPTYDFGTDPFQDGCHMGNPFGTATRCISGSQSSRRREPVVVGPPG